VTAFAPTWMGGQAEQLFRRHGEAVVEDVDVATLVASTWWPQREQRRHAWTIGALQEWCAAVAFVELQQALLAARAPVDLIGATGRFVADEMLHVELACQMAMAFGGGVPMPLEVDEVRPRVDRSLAPWQQAAELAVRISCVGERVSAPWLSADYAAAADPVSRKVLARIAADEAPHGAIGFLVLDWLEDRLDADERQRLGEVADDALAALGEVLATRDDADALVRRGVLAPLRRRNIPAGGSEFVVR